MAPLFTAGKALFTWASATSVASTATAGEAAAHQAASPTTGRIFLRTRPEKKLTSPSNDRSSTVHVATSTKTASVDSAFKKREHSRFRLTPQKIQATFTAISASAHPPHISPTIRIPSCKKIKAPARTPTA
jgi:hypothetical protein